LLNEIPREKMDLTFLIQHPELAKDTTFNLKASDLLNFGDKLVNDMALLLEQRKTEQNKPEQLLNRGEVCEIFNVCKTTLWNWEKKGTLKPQRIGGKVVYRRSDIQQALENK